jgi:hypothetical protein
MTGLEPLIPISLFVSIAAVVILRGPFGKALADRIAGRSAGSGDDARAEMLERQLEDVQYRLHDIEERLDFTERVVAHGRDAPQIPGDQ